MKGKFLLTDRGPVRVDAASATPQYPRPITALLAKHGIKPPPTGLKFSVQDVDEHMRGKTISERLEVKSCLRQIGALK